MLEQTQMFFSSSPLVAGFAVIVLIAVVLMLVRLAGFNLIDELIFMNLHEFDVDEYVTVEKIKKEMPIGMSSKVDEALARFVMQRRVEMRLIDEVKHYRIVPFCRKEPREPRVTTSEYN